MPCNIFAQRYALQAVRNKLRALLTAEISPLTEPYLAVVNVEGKLMANLGRMAPKPMTLLKLLLGLSPGSVKLWLDSDSGYFTEARVKPGAPPVYHYVSDEVAIKILKGELTHELEVELMTPDEYLGE